MGVEKLLVVNESKITRKNIEEVKKLVDEANQTIFSNSAKKSAKSILKSEPKIIQIYGGDGTLSATLNEVLSIDTKFLEHRYIQIMPAGTGNDKYKFLKEQKRKNKDELEVMIDDFLLATINKKHKRYIFNVGGIGLDAQSIVESEKLRNTILSKLRYDIGGFRAIHKVNGFESRMSYALNYAKDENEEIMSGQIENPLMFLFATGKYFGAGKPISKNLTRNDGLFEPILLRKGKHINLYTSLLALSVLKQPQHNNPLVQYLPLTDILALKIQESNKFMFESDGELLMMREEKPTPVKVQEITVQTSGKINYLV